MKISEEFKQKLKSGSISNQEYVDGMIESGLERVNQDGSRYIDIYRPDNKSKIYSLSDQVFYPVPSIDNEATVSRNFQAVQNGLIEGQSITSCSFNLLAEPTDDFKLAIGLKIDADDVMLGIKDWVNLREKPEQILQKSLVENEIKLRKNDKSYLNNVHVPEKYQPTLDRLRNDDLIDSFLDGLQTHDLNKPKDIDIDIDIGLGTKRDEVAKSINDEMSFISDMSKGNEELRQRIANGERFKTTPKI